MEAINNIANFLNKEILLKDNRKDKLEMNLEELLQKENFIKLVKEGASKKEEKTCAKV